MRWIHASDRHNLSLKTLTNNVKVCGCHFILGKPDRTDKNNPDYVPNRNIPSVLTKKPTRQSKTSKKSSEYTKTLEAAEQSSTIVSRVTKRNRRQLSLCEIPSPSNEIEISAEILEKFALPLQAQLLQTRDKSTKAHKGSRFGFVDWRQKKDFHKRECVRDGYAERMRLNAVRKNTILPIEIREAADKQVAALPRDSNPVRLVQRCVMTSRPRAIQKKYRVSRLVWRDFADHGQLPGVTRACW